MLDLHFEKLFDSQTVVCWQDLLEVFLFGFCWTHCKDALIVRNFTEETYMRHQVEWNGYVGWWMGGWLINNTIFINSRFSYVQKAGISNFMCPEHVLRGQFPCILNLKNCLFSRKNKTCLFTYVKPLCVCVCVCVLKGLVTLNCVSVCVLFWMSFVETVKSSVFVQRWRFWTEMMSDCLLKDATQRETLFRSAVFILVVRDC